MSADRDDHRVNWVYPTSDRKTYTELTRPPCFRRTINGLQGWCILQSHVIWMKAWHTCVPAVADGVPNFSGCAIVVLSIRLLRTLKQSHETKNLPTMYSTNFVKKIQEACQTPYLKSALECYSCGIQLERTKMGPTTKTILEQEN